MGKGYQVRIRRKKTANLRNRLQRMHMAGFEKGKVKPTLVREAIPNESQLSLLGVLQDGIESLFFGDFHLGVGPTRNFHNHVEDGTSFIGEKRNVMERGEDGSVLLQEDAVL